MKKLVGFALGTVLSFGTVASAAAAGADFAAPALVPPAGIEVIVVTAKWPVIEPVVLPAAAAQPIEFIVTAKPPTKAAVRMPPVMPIEMPKLELAVAEPLVIRL